MTKQEEVKERLYYRIVTELNISVCDNLWHVVNRNSSDEAWVKVDTEIYSKVSATVERIRRLLPDSLTNTNV